MSDKEIIQTDEDNVEVVSEADASTNMASIASKPTGISRSDLIAKMVAYASQMNKDSLAQAVETLSKTNDEIYASTQQADGDAEKNKATIKSAGKPADPMPSVKEDLALLFGGSDELSEDFRIKTETLFEAAVSTRVAMEVAKLEEQFEEAQKELEENFETTLQESLEEIKQEMLENVDNYLNYAVAEWISENKLAIESNVRTQVAESFMSSLKNVFEEHYVNIPQDKVDVVESLADEVAELKAQINEMTEKNIELSKTLQEKEVEEIASNISEGMTDTQKEKFLKLTEAINFSSADEFRKKVSIIKETYFPPKREVRAVQDQLLSESVEEPEKAASIDPEMQVYVSSITRTLKKS